MNNIVSFEEESLSKISHHINFGEITRLVAKGTPYYLAMHYIQNFENFSKKYVELHKYEKDEIKEVKALPENVISAIETFVCITLQDKYEAYE